MSRQEDHGGQVDLALLGFRVRTLDGERPFATAVAIRRGTIVAVGTDDEIKASCGTATRVITGPGAVVPGLVDSHSHVLSAGSFARGADLTTVHSLDQLHSALEAERERVGDSGWILGWGLEYNVFGDSPMSSDHVEDAVLGQPALLRTMDAHTGLANRAALDLAGVHGPREFEDGSEIVCRDGAPTGELREMSAIALVADVIPVPSSSESKAAAQEVLQRYVSHGVTCIHQMDGDDFTFKLAEELEHEGRLDLRLVISVWHKPETSPEETEAQLAMRDLHGKLWRGGVVKMFGDGVIDTGTGWLLEPDTRGGSLTPFWPEPARYSESVVRFSQAGFQVVTHATGDGAVRSALDAYDRAGAKGPFRHRIEHIETLPDEELRRFAQEGVVASMQPLHMQWRKPDGSDWWASLLGPERTSHAFRCLDLLMTGAIVPLGSDWPVAGLDPREGMAWARLRRTPGDDGFVFEPQQCLSGLQALHGYTTMPAAAVGESLSSGRISPGLRADLTIFAEDPVDCDPDDLVDLPVLMTIVDGRVVWTAAEMAARL
jgi:predicted amidohydrolase YtcJ